MGKGHGARSQTRKAMGMAAAFMIALGITACTSSIEPLTRASHNPTVSEKVTIAFRATLTTLPPANNTPTGPLQCTATECLQKLPDGMLWWAKSKGANAVSGPIAKEWLASGGAAGPLGAPTGTQSCTDGGCHQRFEAGTLVASPSGAVVVGPAFVEAWEANGAEAGPWGVPTAAATCTPEGVCTQPFAVGAVVAVGGSSAPLAPDVEAYWSAQGGADGVLGHPTSLAECGLAGESCRQQFSGGLVVTSPAGGAHRVLPQLVEPWTANGAGTGTWGLPSGEAACTPAGSTCRQSFTGGQVTWRSDVGVLDCRTQQCVALTFDDGPGGETTRLLDILDAASAQATFFVLGNKVPGNESILTRMESEFSEVGVHALTHTPLVDLNAAGQQAEWNQASQLVSAAIGHPAIYGRPPYGLHNADTDATAAAAGLRLVFWDVDSLDWSLRDPVATNARIMSQVEPGDVILMHDVHTTTVDGVAPLIDQLRAAGLVPVSLSELNSAGLPPLG